MLDKLRVELTPARRRRLYGIVIALLSILAAHGVISADDLSQVAAAVGYLFGVGGLGVALRNVNDDK